MDSEFRNNAQSVLKLYSVAYTFQHIQVSTEAGKLCVSLILRSFFLLPDNQAIKTELLFSFLKKRIGRNAPSLILRQQISLQTQKSVSISLILFGAMRFVFIIQLALSAQVGEAYTPFYYACHSFSYSYFYIVYALFFSLVLVNKNNKKCMLTFSFMLV